MSWDFQDVVEVECLRNYTVYVRFDDGLSGELDLSEFIGRGPVFEPLVDRKFFALAGIKGGTIAWPNGADIAPERVYSLLESSQKVATPD